MSKLALDNVSGDFFQLSEKMIESGLRESRKSDRKRMILPIHREQDAKVQRMINFLQPGTYIRPHKHPLDHASESLVIIQGSIRFYTFDKGGIVSRFNKVNSKPLPGVVDIEPRVWHSFIVLEDDTILFECKQGPYDAETDKQFADWSPEEGSNKVKEWMKNFN
ncbi:MAG: WbuC family cupin fold metalloprotein [Balneolaceae bacterium]|nr:WbuC family cupin fold metalloprotein [Balneolaceae bacterium]MDR9410360.1 WbuC family cupin fold metalloprotein [Balneolaceae bacterium]